MGKLIKNIKLKQSIIKNIFRTCMTDKDKEKFLDKNNNSEITKQLYKKEQKDFFDDLDKEIIKKYLK